MKNPVAKACLFFLSIFFSGLLHAQNPVTAKAEAHVLISEISIKNNAITRDEVILRELEFKENEILSVNEVKVLSEESKKNLLNTTLFNFVTISPVWTADSAQVQIAIEVVEKWYIWPYPVLEIADRNINTWLEKKDFSRLNYGVHLQWHNFTGRKDFFKLLLRLGFEEKITLSYESPYFNPAKTLAYSFGIKYARNHEIAYGSYMDKLQYHREENSYARQQLNTFFHLIYRPNFHHKQTVKLFYDSYIFSDTLIRLQPAYTVNQLKRLNFISLSLQYDMEHRDFVPYPLQGYYFGVEFRKLGLKLIQPEGVDFFYIKSRLNGYWKLKNRWYLAGGLSAKISSKGFQPYVLQKGLGYQEDYIRSYELYIMDGQKYALLKGNLKYELIPTKSHTLNFIKSEKFNKLFYSLYLNLFSDIAYIEDKFFMQGNTLTNNWQYSIGLGLDFVTYYNIVMRTEFSVNKQQNLSLFLHVKAPI